MAKSLYIHIPFCKSKCVYCDFTSGFRPEGHYFDNYTDYLIKELKLIKKSWPVDDSIRTVYLGGGTPSLLGLKDLEKLMNYIQYTFRVDSLETTLEANPEDVTAEMAAAWLSMGFNRVSLGFQSMENNILGLLGRRNTCRNNLESFEILRKAGFWNISVDWIASVRGENIDIDLEEILKLGPEHISVYQLTIEDKTLLSQKVKKKEYVPVNDEESVDIYWKIADGLGKHGYSRYEVSNYAKGPEYFSRHNLNYWDYGEYIGAGVGAAGFLFGDSGKAIRTRYSNTGTIKEYFKSLDDGSLPIELEEEISRDAAVREFIMLSLRKTDGLDFKLFNGLFQSDFFEIIDREKLEKLSGFLEITGESIRVTREGLNVLNRIIQEVWLLLPS
jgi:oxygen-independent coproporphyrinogen III oxidase